MRGGFMVLGVTLAFAAASATVFLILRCRGVGRPFGPGSRRCALAVVGLTSLVSTAAAVASATVLQHIPPVLVGAAAPSGLWLGHIRQRADGRRGVGQEMSTLWLAWLLDRMHQGMAEDRLKWCEKRVDPLWGIHELSSAANFYYEYLKERLSPEEHRRERIHSRLQAIERRLDVAQLIEDDAARSKVVGALRASRVTKEPRYERYLNDLPRLGGILRHDAERDLVRLLSSGYRAGCYRLQAFTPSVREPARLYPPGRPLPPHP
jgi:hypothetical protein